MDTKKLSHAISPHVYRGKDLPDSVGVDSINEYIDSLKDVTIISLKKTTI